MAKADTQELLTVRELADILRTSTGNIYVMHARGQIPGAVKIGKRLRFRVEVINQWITDSTTTTINDIG